jgi:hypothetical protein
LDDFFFQLTDKEREILRCQIGTSSLEVNLRYQIGTAKYDDIELETESYNNTQDLRSKNETSSDWGGRRTPPYAFTEQGVAMLSSVLRSDRAVKVNIEIMRAFVNLREMIASNQALAHRLDELEKKFDGQFRIVFDAIRQLMAPPVKEKGKIGFRRVEK